MFRDPVIADGADVYALRRCPSTYESHHNDNTDERCKAGDVQGQ